MGDAQRLGGIERGHAQGLLERQAKGAVHIGDGVDHGEVGAGKRAIGKPEGRRPGDRPCGR